MGSSAHSPSVTCSICSASSFGLHTSVHLCAGCACLYVCEGCSKRHAHSPDCTRLRATRHAAIDAGFYEFPFAWYPSKPRTFGCVRQMLEYLGVKPGSAVAQLLTQSAVRNSSKGSIYPFPNGTRSENDSKSILEDVQQHMDAFWGSEGNAFFLGRGTGTGAASHPVYATQTVPKTSIISDWDTYIAMRPGSGHFPLILDSAMTVYAAITRYRRLRCAWAQDDDRNVIKVTLLGVEVHHEARYWPTFLELFNVLPDAATIRLVMMGPELPTALHGLQHSVIFSRGRKLEVEMRQADCEGSEELLADSHVLCALNAGLPAYHSWETGLLAIKQSGFRGVLVVTDLVEEALYLGRELLVRVFGDRVGQVQVNGFRRPDACVRPTGHAMPSCGGSAFKCFVDCLN